MFRRAIALALVLNNQICICCLVCVMPAPGTARAADAMPCCAIAPADGVPACCRPAGETQAEPPESGCCGTAECVPAVETQTEGCCAVATPASNASCPNSADDCTETCPPTDASIPVSDEATDTAPARNCGDCSTCCCCPPLQPFPYEQPSMRAFAAPAPMPIPGTAVPPQARSAAVGARTICGADGEVSTPDRLARLCLLLI